MSRRVAGLRVWTIVLMVGGAPISAVDPQETPQAIAQPTDVPVVSEVDKLKVLAVTKDIQIAQLQAQAAQKDFEAARAELMRMVQSLQRDGYELDMSTLTYKPKPVEKK